MDIYNLTSINLSLKNKKSLIKKIYFFKEIDSTNTHLKNNFHKYKTGDVILAENQTRSRGKNNRKWQSEKSKGLYLSILLKNTLSLKELNFLSLLTASSINKILQEIGFDSKIKWPNDIYINERKVCGILIENIMDSSINNTIIGIGININNTSFNSDIKDIASSLYLESNGVKFNSYMILYKILELLDTDILRYIKNRSSDDFIEYIKDNCLNLNKNINLSLGGDIVSGVFIDILPDGSIKVLDKNNHSLILNYGEIISH